MKNKEVSILHKKRLDAISTYLRELRYSEGMTQLELSNQLNLHRNTIQRAETGENTTLLTIFELADVFDIKMSQLFEVFD